MIESEKEEGAVAVISSFIRRKRKRDLFTLTHMDSNPLPRKDFDLTLYSTQPGKTRGDSYVITYGKVLRILIFTLLFLDYYAKRMN